MTEHQKKKISQLGESVFGLKMNTVATILGVVISTGIIFGWVVAPIKSVVQQFRVLDKMALDVNEIKTKGSKPLQEMNDRLNSVCDKVKDISDKGSDPLRERIIKVETTIQGLQPTLERIERKIDRHIATDERYGISKSTTPSPLPSDKPDTR